MAIRAHTGSEMREPRRDHYIERSPAPTPVPLSTSPSTIWQLLGTSTVPTLPRPSTSSPAWPPRPRPACQRRSPKPAATAAPGPGSQTCSVSPEPAPGNAGPAMHPEQPKAPKYANPPPSPNHGPPEQARGAPGRMPLGPDRRLDQPLKEDRMPKTQQYQGFLSEAWTK